MRARRAVWSAAVALAALAAGCWGDDEPARRVQVPSALAAAPGVDACARAPAGMRATRIPADGGGLKAAVLGHGATTAVFANEGSSGPCPWLPLAMRLARRGARAVVFEYGERTPEAEVAAAARWARRTGDRPAALVGAGRGARAVVLVAVRHPQLVGPVVTQSAEQLRDGRDDLIPDARRLRGPVLWVGSRDDNLTNWGTDTRELSRATQAPHELILVRTGHGLELLSGAEAARVVPALERFVFAE
jgi:hypothetical protein